MGINLIILINEFREKNNLQKFSVSKSLRLPNYVMKESSEIMINPEKSFFNKLNKKFLFKYPVGEFENKFKNKDPNILSVLLKDNLNHINIITKDNTEFIHIYERL